MGNQLSESVVLVCGGRDYNDGRLVFDSLDAHHAKSPIVRLVHGGASGADYLAGEWAKSRGVPCDVYAADWNTHGRAAGPIRNERMFRESLPGRVVAFPGGRGTSHMVSVAIAGGAKVSWPASDETTSRRMTGEKTVAPKPPNKALKSTRCTHTRGSACGR